MKKVIIVFSVLVLAGIFSSCEKKAEPKVPAVKTETVAADTTVADTAHAETPAPAPEK